MSGTQNHEGIAGVLAAVEYLEELGRLASAAAGDRRERLVAAFERITEYEQDLVAHLLHGLASLEKVTVWGIKDVKRLAERVPTVSVTHASRTPLELAKHLADRAGSSRDCREAFGLVRLSNSTLRSTPQASMRESRSISSSAEVSRVPNHFSNVL